MDGRVQRAILGADWPHGRAMTGFAVAHSRGAGNYRAPAGGGKVSSRITGVYPYGRYEAAIG